jgi:hypothetical protein
MVVTENRAGHGSAANMNEQLATFFERLARKAWVQRLLRRMGLDGRQFMLFLELFRTLSEREELMGIVGVSRFQVSYLALYAFALGVIPWAGLASLPPRMFLIINLSVAFALTFPVIVREAANALFNPVESSMLAHKPVHSPTYVAAKVVHVLIAVLYLTSGVTMYAALMGALLNKATRWFWPITHLGSAFLIGLWTAFSICALYGWLATFVPSNLLKAISLWIQLLSLIAFISIPIFFPQVLTSLFTARFESGGWTWLPLAWFTELGLMGCRGASWRLAWQGAISIVATTVVIWYGLRSFCGICLSEVSSIVEGRVLRRPQRTVFSRGIASLIRAVTGSPLGLGAFCFVSKMIRRDWQFRRAILTQTWIPLVIMLALFLEAARSGFFPSPVGHESPAHILPHLLGLITMALCLNMPFTDFHSGSWMFLTAPIGRARPFARGIYWSLWCPAAGLPNLALLPLMIHFWGWKEGALCAGFSLVVVSLYLGIEITRISGLPFSNPINESRATGNAIYVQLCCLMAITFPALLQWALFQLWSVAIASAIVLAFLTCFVVHWTLRELDGDIRWRLHIMKMGPAQMFREMG